MIYKIIVYDVKSKRCNKYNRVLKKYLLHTQKSVFEGLISEANYKRLMEVINSFKNPEDNLKEFDVINYHDKKLESKGIIIL